MSSGSPRRGERFVVARVYTKPWHWDRFVVAHDRASRDLAWWMERYPGCHIELDEGSAWGCKWCTTRRIAETCANPPTVVLMQGPDGRLFGLRNTGEKRGGVATYAPSARVWALLTADAQEGA